MAPIGYHVRMRLRDHRVILCSPAEQRLLARVVLHQSRNQGLLAFSLPDTHLHLEVLCTDRAASRLCQRIGSSLKQRQGRSVGFITYPHEPLRDQRHVHNTFHYILTQHERHGLSAAAIREATNIPDLLGMRAIGALCRERVRRALPRIGDEMIRTWASLSGLRPASGPVSALVGATLAATALCDLRGRSRPVGQARRAMLEILGDQVPRAEAARMLGLTERSLYLILGRPVAPALVRAIQLQLGAQQLQGSAP